ncbi:MAG: hypothetical protein WCX75_04250 [Fibrobacteraceae bacterium]
MRHINILGLSLLLFTIGASAKSDLDREGLIGPVQSIVYNDTQKVFSEVGALLSEKNESSATIQYDSKNRPSLKTDGSLKTFYKYDFDGQLEKLTTCNDKTKKCTALEYQYNNQGLLVNENHCEGQGSEYTCPYYIKNIYDENDRLKERRLCDSIGTIKNSTVYTYNKKGILNEESEFQFIGGKKVTLRFCEYNKGDSHGNWTSRKCFHNRKEQVTTREVKYYGDVPVELSSTPLDSSATPRNEGTFPVTGGFVDGSFILAEKFPIHLDLNSSGLNGRVQMIRRKVYSIQNKKRSFESATEQGYSENGKQTYWTPLDSSNQPLCRISLRNDAAGLHVDVEKEIGSISASGDIKVDLNSYGDWQRIEIVPTKGFSEVEGPIQYIHRYDKLGRMIKHNQLIFEYNAMGNVEKVWLSDVLFDAFFFSPAGKMTKIIRYDCASGKCNVQMKSAVKVDDKGNVIEERISDSEGNAAKLVLTEIQYYP